MPTLPLKRFLAFVILLALAVSCAPQAAWSLPAGNPTATPSAPLPALTPTRLPDTGSVSQPTHGPKAPTSAKGGSSAAQNTELAIPEHSLDLILGRPTETSITFSLLSPANDQTLFIAYGTQPGAYSSQTERFALSAGVPREVTLTGLIPDTRYYYTVDMGGQENTFHTARASGSSFAFTIQADSHLDSNTSLDVYQQALANQRADDPDFIIDLGDTFMTDKYRPYTDALPQYLAQHYYLGQPGTPLYLVLGNHDGEGAPRGPDGVEMSAWAVRQRTTYFPNPLPDAFYSGNAGQSYYAWTWGDALFIVLDPYTSTPPLHNNSSLWDNTLGREQYQWLKSTLETSRAKWKFIFIHQLLSGTNKNGRGGVEVAPYYEWGGRNPDGSDGFAANRPGWDAPIHQLLVTNHVTAVFHGHDHLFVKQELDGIIYQEVPQPGADRSNTNSAAEYGYLSGDVLGGPGHIRVTVEADEVKVEYVRAYLPQDEKPGQKNGQVDYSYTIHPR